MFENKHISPEKPPKRLFRVIIERLRLEKSLKIFEEKFSVLLIIFVISIGLVVFGLLALRSELAGSESVSLFSLLFSDTGIILSYFKYFVLAVLESMPVISITISLIAFVLLMISLRFIVSYYEKILTLAKLIKNKN